MTKQLQSTDSALKLFSLPGLIHRVWILGSWALLALPTLIYPVGRDQGVFAYVGSRLLEGEKLYSELWDVKSPLIYWTYALAQWALGNNIFAIRVFDALVALLTTYLLWNLTVKIMPARYKQDRHGAATVASVVYLLWHYLPNDYRVLANCESFIQPFVMLALLYFITANRESTPRRKLKLFLLAGVMLGIMPLYKTTATVFLFPALLTMFLARENYGAFFKNCTALSIGFATPLLLGMAYLMQTGAWSDWLFLNLEYLPAYTALSHQGGITHSLKVALYFAKDMLLIYPALVAGMALFLWRLPSVRNKALATVALFALTYAGVVIVQGKYLHYHFLPFLAPFALVITVTALSALEDLRSKVWQRMLALTIIALTLAHVWKAPERYADFYSVTTGTPETKDLYCEKLSMGNYPCSGAHQVGRYLKNNASENASLFVWSFEPEIYYLSGLDHASRFLFNTPFLSGAVADQWRTELVATLSANPPEYFVVGVDDGLPLIVGSTYSSAERLSEVPGLLEFLANYYDEDTLIDRFIIFRYRSLASTEIKSESEAKHGQAPTQLAMNKQTPKL